METKPKIFAFINERLGSDVIVTALAESGDFLASHYSSTENYAKYDIGVTSERKHDLFKEHYPNGYELVWVDGNPKKHDGVIAAYKKHTGMSGA